MRVIAIDSGHATVEFTYDEVVLLYDGWSRLRRRFQRMSSALALGDPKPTLRLSAWLSARSC